jgi:hypothetical protein
MLGAFVLLDTLLGRLGPIIFISPYLTSKVEEKVRRDQDDQCIGVFKALEIRFLFL